MKTNKCLKCGAEPSVLCIHRFAQMGGKKSKRKLTHEQAMEMVKARKDKKEKRQG